MASGELSHVARTQLLLNDIVRGSLRGQDPSFCWISAGIVSDFQRMDWHSAKIHECAAPPKVAAAHLERLDELANGQEATLGNHSISIFKATDEQLDRLPRDPLLSRRDHLARLAAKLRDGIRVAEDYEGIVHLPGQPTEFGLHLERRCRHPDFATVLAPLVEGTGYRSRYLGALVFCLDGGRLGELLPTLRLAQAQAIQVAGHSLTGLGYGLVAAEGRIGCFLRPLIDYPPPDNPFGKNHEGDFAYKFRAVSQFIQEAWALDLPREPDAMLHPADAATGDLARRLKDLYALNISSLRKEERSPHRISLAEVARILNWMATGAAVSATGKAGASRVELPASPAILTIVALGELLNYLFSKPASRKRALSLSLAVVKEGGVRVSLGIPIAAQDLKSLEYSFWEVYTRRRGHGGGASHLLSTVLLDFNKYLTIARTASLQDAGWIRELLAPSPRPVLAPHFDERKKLLEIWWRTEAGDGR